MAIFSNNFYFKWSVVSSIVIVIYRFVGVMLSVNDVIRYGTFRELVINMRYPSDKSNSFSTIKYQQGSTILVDSTIYYIYLFSIKLPDENKS